VVVFGRTRDHVLPLVDRGIVDLGSMDGKLDTIEEERSPWR
jgi:hypothetical protein